MAAVLTPAGRPVTRRKFIRNSLIAAAGLAVYAGEIERHIISVSNHVAAIPGLPAAFEGVRIAQISDIHLDEFTEPAFLEHAVNLVNNLNPDYVFLTGDFVTDGHFTRKFSLGAAWQCADILRNLKCAERYAILGNHDIMVGWAEVIKALSTNGTPVLINQHTALERNGGRMWLAGVLDPVTSRPKPDVAIPPAIRGIAEEPVILLCHAPDYVDRLVKMPVAQDISLMLCGHTHGGQVRLPLIGPISLPPLGRKYVEGWFRFGGMQMYVNRGLGTVDLPFRFDCPPEISIITLRRADSSK
jgi:uncharacterized protein